MVVAVVMVVARLSRLRSLFSSPSSLRLTPCQCVRVRVCCGPCHGRLFCACVGTRACCRMLAWWWSRSVLLSRGKLVLHAMGMNGASHSSCACGACKSSTRVVQPGANSLLHSLRSMSINKPCPGPPDIGTCTPRAPVPCLVVCRQGACACACVPITSGLASWQRSSCVCGGGAAGAESSPDRSFVAARWGTST